MRRSNFLFSNSSKIPRVTLIGPAKVTSHPTVECCVLIGLVPLPLTFTLERKGHSPNTSQGLLLGMGVALERLTVPTE